MVAGRETIHQKVRGNPHFWEDNRNLKLRGIKSGFLTSFNHYQFKRNHQYCHQLSLKRKGENIKRKEQKLKSNLLPFQRLNQRPFYLLVKRLDTPK